MKIGRCTPKLLKALEIDKGGFDSIENLSYNVYSAGIRDLLWKVF